MKRIKFLVLLFLMALPCLTQERPPIQIYTPKDYGAENQNWSISQSKDKFIYVANNKGLLEFNGEAWNLYPSPNESIMRSVNVIDERIYTGNYREFGFWERNNFGKLNYTSISQKLNIQFLDDEDFWNIIGLDDYILFQSLERIYIYNKIDETYSIIESETTIYKMFKVNESIYFQKVKEGIYKIENGQSRLISDDPVLKNNFLANIFDYNGQFLIQTEDYCFYILDGTGINKWNIPANDILSKVSVYRSIQLRDNSFLLGTISNGILHLTLDGELNFKIDYIQGLSINTVHSVFEDDENHIWLGLENGVNCINLESPFAIYNDETDKIGTVYASSIFKGNLYLGTNQGLFYKSINSNDKFTFIKGTQGAVWCLVQLDDKLFCGHNSGTFIVNENKAERISDVQGTWNIIPIKNRNDLLLQGNYDGLYILQKNKASWILRNKIKGFDISSKFFEMPTANEILVSHEYKGVFTVNIDDDYTKSTTIIKDSNLEKGSKSSLIRYNNDILYKCKDGVFKYNFSDKQFQRDSILSSSFKKEDYASGKLIADIENKGIWSFSNKNLSYISYGGLSNIPKIKKISFSKSLPRGLAGYENITHLQGQKYLLGTADGYIIIDLQKLHEKSYRVDINSIAKSDVKNNVSNVNKLTNGVFKNSSNNLELTYSVANFDKYLDTEYQYQLEGLYNQWSAWSSNSYVTFNNLPFGSYTFNVKAKVGNTVYSNIASYSFEVERPWSLSNIMIAIYALAIMLLSLMIHTTYKKYYKKQRKKLLDKTTKELVLKELENKQQLMQFKNEKLNQDIENKNNELAISTMNLIKKNEFLNGIKKELKQTESDKEIKQVIKIIDRHLNNADDWRLFEEAFNNADKDFLKKIKSEHPSLTHNDLRLCTYLRLNLSSKEIAPLLNISSRSVEVKRYRLRKKIGLEHESSLTDYILEI